MKVYNEREEFWLNRFDDVWRIDVITKLGDVLALGFGGYLQTWAIWRVGELSWFTQVPAQTHYIWMGMSSLQSWVQRMVSLFNKKKATTQSLKVNTLETIGFPTSKVCQLFHSVVSR